MHNDGEAAMTVLHYFKGRGRAETTRWMLAVNGIAFENQAVEMPQALAALRASGKLPFDQMPLLEIDEQNLSQSTAMIRYLARRGDCYGDNDTDALWCDMIAGAVADFAQRPRCRRRFSRRKKSPTALCGPASRSSDHASKRALPVTSRVCARARA